MLTKWPFDWVVWPTNTFTCSSSGIWAPLIVLNGPKGESVYCRALLAYRCPPIAVETGGGGGQGRQAKRAEPPNSPLSDPPLHPPLPLVDTKQYVLWAEDCSTVVLNQTAFSRNGCKNGQEKILEAAPNSKGWSISNSFLIRTDLPHIQSSKYSPWSDCHSKPNPENCNLSSKYDQRSKCHGWLMSWPQICWSYGWTAFSLKIKGDWKGEKSLSWRQCDTKPGFHF